MPAYDYHCETNGRTVEVSHAMTTLLQTWGQLCDSADLDPGETPVDAPLRRVFSAPLIGGKEPAAAAQPTASVACQPSGCACCR